MDTPQPQRLRRPAFAKELLAAVGMPTDQVYLSVHIGRTAWSRAKQHRASREGFQIVVPIDHEAQPADYDFTCFDRLWVWLHAQDCDYALARACAIRICQHGAAAVLMFHPNAQDFPALADFWQGAPR